MEKSGQNVAADDEQDKRRTFLREFRGVGYIQMKEHQHSNHGVDAACQQATGDSSNEPLEDVERDKRQARELIGEVEDDPQGNGHNETGRQTRANTPVFVAVSETLLVLAVGGLRAAQSTRQVACGAERRRGRADASRTLYAAQT